MQREVFVVEKERFDLSDEKIYHLQGTWPKEHTAAAELDGKSLEVNLKQQERISALERFQDLDLVDAIRVQMEIVLPDKLEQYKKLVVYAKENGKKEVWFSIPVKQLIRRQGMPQYFIENSEVDRKLGICRVRGLSLIHIYHWGWTVYFWIVTVVLFALGSWIFKRLKPHFADVL